MIDKKIKAQAKFIHVDGLGLVMQIHDFNELINSFKLEESITSYTSMNYGKNAPKGKSELQRAIEQRHKSSI